MKKKSRKKKQDIAKVNPELEGLDKLGASVLKEIKEGKFKRMSERRKEISANHEQSMKEVKEGKIKFY